MKLKDPTHSSAIFSLLILSTLFVLSSAPPPSPPPPGGCAAVLVAFSPCLPYVSSLPNNVSDTASSQCCDMFSSTFESGDGGCLCYLLRQPHLLGFPLNETRILSLSSVCPSMNASSAVTNSSLELMCSVSPALPPLRSATAGLGLPNPSDSASAKSPSFFMSLPPKSAESPPTPPSSSEPATDSSATKQINNSSSSSSSSCSQFLPGIMTSLALTFTIFQ